MNPHPLLRKQMIPKTTLTLILALCLSAALRAQDVARDVHITSNLTGTIAIDSARFAQGKPAAQFERLAEPTFGRNGYVIFRYQATDWWDKHEPLLQIRPPIAYVPNPKEKARFQDRLYAGVKKKDLRLLLDGKSADGASGIQGGSLWNTPEPQQAYWDFAVKDTNEHMLTLFTCHGAAMTYRVAPLDSPEASQELATLEEDLGAVAIQFRFQGSIRIFLDQTAFTPDDLGKGFEKRHRKPANISAIFID